MEFEIKGQAYRAGKLDAFRQFHIMRRLAPLLAATGGSVEAIKSDPLAAFLPLVQGLADLPDADADFVLNACLDVVQRQQGPAWARVRAQSGGLMFEDIGMADMLQMVGRVLLENFADFFGDLPDLKAGKAPQDLSR